MIREFASSPVTLPALDSGAFDDDGLVISQPEQLLRDVGADPATSHALTLLNSGVQSARPGAIQDPAGSAIGEPKPSGGGASGAIYSAFPDLRGIPSIKPRSAIFNASDGDGKRVLHSYSPQLAGAPDDAEDRRKALEDIANTYCNAILAFNARAADLGNDGQLLNLVPVSAAIYAGAFANPTYPPRGHLDPSYTITAIQIAISALRKHGDAIPRLRLCYFDKTVFNAAEAFLAQLAV